MTKDLIQEFEIEIANLISRTSKETHCNISRFVEMVQELRGLGACKRLLDKDFSDSMEKSVVGLLRSDRVDLTIEYFIYHNSKYHKLFTTKQLETVRDRVDNQFPIWKQLHRRKH